MCADSRFAEPRQTFRKESLKGGAAAERSREAAKICCDSNKNNAAKRRRKDLILLVGSCCLGGLIRGLENLESPCEGVRVVTFCVVQKVTKKHARTCKKLPVASFCASETAETGRIANGCEQGDHVSRRSRVATLWTPGDDSKLCRRRFQRSFPTARVDPGFSHKTAAKRL